MRVSKYLFAAVAIFMIVMIASFVIGQGPAPSGNKSPGPAGTIAYQAIWDKGGGTWWVGWPPPSMKGTWVVEHWNGTSWHATGYEDPLIRYKWIDCSYPTFAQADAKANGWVATAPQASYRVFGYISQP